MIPVSCHGPLLDVLTDQLGQLEHRNGRLPAKNRLQRRIRIDLALVLGVLQAMDEALAWAPAWGRAPRYGLPLGRPTRGRGLPGGEGALGGLVQPARHR
jgi:hypothetical protein